MTVTTASSPSSTPSDLEIEIELFHQPAIDSARKMILWAGTIYLAFPVLLFAVLARLAGPGVFATSAFLITFGIGAAIFGAHVALWWWAKTSPLAATSIALIVFIGYRVVSFASGDGASWLVSIVGLVILGRAVLAGYRVHKLRAAAARERLAAAQR